MSGFDVFSLLECRKRKTRSHGIRKKYNRKKNNKKGKKKKKKKEKKKKKRANKKANTRLNYISKILKDHGRHSMLPFLISSYVV